MLQLLQINTRHNFAKENPEMCKTCWLTFSPRLTNKIFVVAFVKHCFCFLGIGFL